MLTLASEGALDGAGLPVAFGVLVCFIGLGIVFDIIGVAVTAADERPFHSMAAHKTPGAREALGLIRRANKVSSFCNDVVGDICGIISGVFHPVCGNLPGSHGLDLRSDHRREGPGQDLCHQ